MKDGLTGATCNTFFLPSKTLYLRETIAGVLLDAGPSGKPLGLKTCFVAGAGGTNDKAGPLDVSGRVLEDVTVAGTAQKICNKIHGRYSPLLEAQRCVVVPVNFILLWDRRRLDQSISVVRQTSTGIGVD